MQTRDDRWRVGIDVGGTTIDAIMINQHGTIAARKSVQTRAGEHAVVMDCIDLVHQLLDTTRTTSGDVLQIGVGVPGVVDHVRGIVRNAVNVGLTEVPLAHHLTSAIGAPATIDNDVNAATLGAVSVFAPPQSGSLAFLNVGTGLAAGLYSHGRLMRGQGGLAGELGHLPSRDLSLARCGCGSHGCLETIASGHALTVAWRDQSIAFSTALAAGHREALAIWDRLIAGVVRALELVTLMWDPETIVVGGGVARHHDRFAHDLVASWAGATAGSTLLASPTDTERIHIADPQTPLGALGAALLGNDALSLTTRPAHA